MVGCGKKWLEVSRNGWRWKEMVGVSRNGQMLTEMVWGWKKWLDRGWKKLLEAEKVVGSSKMVASWKKWLEVEKVVGSSKWLKVERNGWRLKKWLEFENGWKLNKMVEGWKKWLKVEREDWILINMWHVCIFILTLIRKGGEQRRI